MAISSRKALRRGENGGTQVVEGSLYVPALYLGPTIVFGIRHSIKIKVFETEQEMGEINQNKIRMKIT